MMFLSIHIFTTVGFGSDSPGDCLGPQLLVFLEHFVSLLDVSVFTAVILAKLMRAAPEVRFSKNFLISQEADGSKWLTFRMVKESHYPLRDCELSVQCGLLTRDGDKVTSCTEETLKILAPKKSNLETWLARHRIDEGSPLHMRQLKDLAFMNVALKVFDTAFQQEVRIYHNYTPANDGVRNARFEPMKYWLANDAEPFDDESKSTSGTSRETSGSSKRKRKQCLEHFVNHSKLDAHRKTITKLDDPFHPSQAGLGRLTSI
jgi:hypothetical protein